MAFTRYIQTTRLHEIVVDVYYNQITKRYAGHLRPAGESAREDGTRHVPLEAYRHTSAQEAIQEMLGEGWEEAVAQEIRDKVDASEGRAIAVVRVPVGSNHPAERRSARIVRDLATKLVVIVGTETIELSKKTGRIVGAKQGDHAWYHGWSIDESAKPKPPAMAKR